MTPERLAELREWAKRIPSGVKSEAKELVEEVEAMQAELAEARREAEEYSIKAVVNANERDDLRTKLAACAEALESEVLAGLDPARPLGQAIAKALAAAKGGG